MTSIDLTCVCFPDVAEWERAPVEMLMAHFSAQYRTQVLYADKRFAVDWGKAQDSKAVWVLARDWKVAFGMLKKIGVPRSYVSVFGLGESMTPMPTLFVRRFRSLLTKSSHILTHSPINFRFFREIEAIQSRQISYLHLPMGKVGQFVERPTGEPFRVGMMGHFNRESNYNFFANIAHYVHQVDPQVRFRALGDGAYHKHIAAMAHDLGLASIFEIVKTSKFTDLNEVDLLLYIPMRNHHFIPVLMAATQQIPVLSSEVPGITDYIQDGKDGFVIPMHETKPMGELIIRLKKERTLRLEMGKTLATNLSGKLQVSVVAQEYNKIFFHQTSKSVHNAA